MKYLFQIIINKRNVFTNNIIEANNSPNENEINNSKVNNDIDQYIYNDDIYENIKNIKQIIYTRKSTR